MTVFDFDYEALDAFNRAVLAAIIPVASDAQRAAIAGDDGDVYQFEAARIRDAIAQAAIDTELPTGTDEAGYLRVIGDRAAEFVRSAFPELSPEVVGEAGNLYAFLNR